MAKKRPSFEDIYMRLATMMAERSTCRRLNVGCVITSQDFRQVLAVGYNGGASGLKNDCDRIGEAAVGNCGCIHAEQNAVINCHAYRYEKKVVFCTHLPCEMCAKFLINLGGVSSIFYLNDYRIKTSLITLNEAKIEVGHLLEGRDIGEAIHATSLALEQVLKDLRGGE